MFFARAKEKIDRVWDVFYCTALQKIVAMSFVRYFLQFNNPQKKRSKSGKVDILTPAFNTVATMKIFVSSA